MNEPWATVQLSPHPAHLECRYCAGLMRADGEHRKHCACGASVVETPMQHGDMQITHRQWAGPKREQGR